MNESLAIVIASKNRPADIARAIESIRAQATQPEQLIVVDQSDQRYDIDPAPGLLHHYDPAIGGLTIARNVGIGLNDCAIVLFLDDDVELISDVVAAVRRSLRAHADAVGVQCDIRFPSERTLVEPPGLGRRLWDLWQRVFWRGFFANEVEPKGKDGELQRVHGCAMAFRSTLFDREMFDQNLVDYSFGEDWEFSKRARRHGRLFLVADAVLVHHESPANRYRQRRQLEQRWHNFRYFYKKLEQDRGLADAVWLRWWILGETLVWLRKGYGLPRGSTR